MSYWQNIAILGIFLYCVRVDKVSLFDQNKTFVKEGASSVPVRIQTWRLVVNLQVL